jgi:IS5 family transposase
MIIHLGLLWLGVQGHTGPAVPRGGRPGFFVPSYRPGHKIPETPPYDGHTLNDALEQVERLTGVMPEHAQVDKGYRGHGIETATDVHLAGSRREAKSRAALHWMKRRQAVEPIIGHLKDDHRMDRNFLHGPHGDRINAMLAAAAFNLRKMTRAFLCALLYDIRSGLQPVLRRLSIHLLSLYQLPLAMPPVAA